MSLRAQLASYQLVPVVNMELNPHRLVSPVCPPVLSSPLAPTSPGCVSVAVKAGVVVVVVVDWGVDPVITHSTCQSSALTMVTDTSVQVCKSEQVFQERTGGQTGEIRDL